MPERPSITDDSIIMRWMRLELGKINKGIVSERKPLSKLRKEKPPSSKTKDGEEYLFDEEMILMLAEKISIELHDALKLPILFYCDLTVGDSCYLTDAIAVQTLQQLGEISEMRSLHDGKLWISKVIVYSLSKKYPTVIQMVMM